MSVDQYEAKFEELSMSSKYHKETHDEYWKCIYFKMGLQAELRDRVATHKIREYSKPTSVVRITKENLNACKAGSEKRMEKRNSVSQQEGKVNLGTRNRKLLMLQLEKLIFITSNF